MDKQIKLIVAEGHEEMTAASVSREIASQLNPLIDGCWTEDTLQNVARVVYELGYLTSTTDLAHGNMYHVFSAASAALDWERENICSVVQARKERGHE